MGSWFEQAFQNPKRLLLLFSGAIFDDAMEFLDQDSRICFLSFEFEKLPTAKHLGPSRWHK